MPRMKKRTKKAFTELVGCLPEQGSASISLTSTDVTHGKTAAQAFPIRPAYGVASGEHDRWL